MRRNFLPFFLLLTVAACCSAQQFTNSGKFATSRQGLHGVQADESETIPPPGGPLPPSSFPSIAEAVTPEIQTLARGLENDPKRIFDFVHDHIRHVLYFGSKKGAHLTLLERSGNDFDQCALLVALLRTAGFSPTYHFGLLKMPYESSDHNDIRHWFGLSLTNTDYSTTQLRVGTLLEDRGYPTWFSFADNNSFAFHRVWVTLTVGSNTYFLDPAFKVSEPILSVIDLPTAMGLDTNALMTVASGTATADYVQNLSEAPLRNKLRDYTTNLLTSLQSNYPNASVEQIISGTQIIPSTSSALSQSLAFPTYDHGGQLQAVAWDNEPTNLMSQLAISFAGTNAHWCCASEADRKVGESPTR